jgi:hypothetical protein
MEASDYLVKASDYLVEASYDIDDSTTTYPSQTTNTDISIKKIDIFLTKISKNTTQNNIESSNSKNVFSINLYILLAIFFLLCILVALRVIFFKKSKINFNVYSEYHLIAKCANKPFLKYPVI